MPYPLDQVNAGVQNIFANSVVDAGAIRLSRILTDGADSLLVDPATGEFPAVVLSGIRTEDNVTGTDLTDSDMTSKYIIVRPLDDSLVSVPDPKAYQGLEIDEQYFYVQSTIALHASEFLARYEFPETDMNKPTFGEIVMCYYEAGGDTPQDPSKLRYKSRTGVPNYNIEYRDLMLLAIGGEDTAKSIFEGTDRVLPQKMGDMDLIVNMKLDVHKARSAEEKKKRAKAAAALGLSSNIVGKRTQEVTKIVMHYTAGHSNKSVLDALEGESRSKPWGYHYMIGVKGDFIETCPPDYNVMHAGGGVWKDTIGVGLLNFGVARKSPTQPYKPADYPTVSSLPNSGGSPGNQGWVKGPNLASGGSDKQRWFEKYTAEQIEPAVTIVGKLCNDFNLGVDAIVTHHDTKATKTDSGPAFSADGSDGNDLANFKSLVQQRMSRSITSKITVGDLE